MKQIAIKFSFNISKTVQVKSNRTHKKNQMNVLLTDVEYETMKQIPVIYHYGFC